MIVLTVITIYISFTPFALISNMIIVKHIALFIVGVAWLFLTVSVITDAFLKQSMSTKMENKLILSRTLIMVLGIISLLVFQLNYIEKVDSYIDYRCEYYDSHYNLIFSSPRIYYCPEINVVDREEYKLTFTTESTYIGMNQLESLEYIDVSSIDSNTIVEVDSFTTTMIEYDEQFRIIRYDNQLTEIIQYDDVVVYTSVSKIVENTYGVNSFETTVSTGSFLENQSNRTDHYRFEETDYQQVTTYTSKENLLDHPFTDVAFYVIQRTDEKHDNVVAVGIPMGGLLYNFTEDLHALHVVDISNFTQDDSTFYRMDARYQVNSEGVRDFIFSLDYELQPAGYYSMFSKQDQKPDEYKFQSNQSRGFGNLTFNDNGNHSYYVMDGIFYSFIETEYGLKVIDKRNHQFTLFSSLEEQLKNNSLSIMNDQYLNLHDYYANATDYPYYVPEIIISSINPLFLQTIK